MLMDKTERGVGFLLTDVSHLLGKVIDRRLQPRNLTRAQWAVLVSVATAEGSSQSQLADELEIEKSSAGRLIDTMQESGWIERRPIPGNRRAWGIHLTEQAKPVIGSTQEIILQTRGEALRHLSTEEQRVLNDILERIKANLKEMLKHDAAC